MKKRNLLLVILAVLLVFGMVLSCGDTGEEGDGTGSGKGTPVTFSDLKADGAALQTTTKLTLTFSEAITGLVTGDITLSGVTGATGVLSGTGPTYTLAIDGFSAGGTLTVKVTKSGYAISPATKTVSIFVNEAAVYFGGYKGVYKIAATDKDFTNEFIKFEENKLEIWDSSQTLPALDYITFNINKWEKDSVPVWEKDDEYPQTDRDKYTIAYKLTGKITAGNPIGANIYGSKTAPGFTQKDIDDKVDAYMYIYIREEDDDNDLYLLRTPFSKDGKAVAPVNGGNKEKSIRFYQELSTLVYPN